MGGGLSWMHRAWRALPAAPRRAGLRAVAGMLAPRADKTPPALSDGVVVGGELGATTGLAEAARVTADACAVLGKLRGRVTRGVGQAPRGVIPQNAALILAINAPSLPLMLARADKNFLRGRRVIGSWAWELPMVPASWAVGERYVQDVWACSRFTAQALEVVMPGRVRVVPYPLAMRPLAQVTGTRADLGLPEGVVITTLIFSLGSSFTRKNPLAAMRAFALAFGDRDDQLLVIKFSGEAAFPAEAAQIKAAAKPNMRVFAGAWPGAKVESLIALSDIVISLHRSEGFGLVPAQAMLRGVPVVATAFSGNMDYMDSCSAALVDYRLVPVDDPSQIYEPMQGAVWAEPDVAHAAEHLRRLGDDAAARLALGAAGRDFAARALDGAALRDALAANGV